MRVMLHIEDPVDPVLDPVLAVLRSLPEVCSGPGDLTLWCGAPPATNTPAIEVRPASWCAPAVQLLGPMVSTAASDGDDATMAWIGDPGDPLRFCPPARDPLAAQRQPGVRHLVTDAVLPMPGDPAVIWHMMDGLVAKRPELLLACDGIVTDDGPLAWDAMRLGLPLIPRTPGKAPRHPTAAVLSAGAALNPAVWRAVLQTALTTREPLDLPTVTAHLPWWDRPASARPRLLRRWRKLIEDPRQFFRDARFFRQR